MTDSLTLVQARTALDGAAVSSESLARAALTRAAEGEGPRAFTRVFEASALAEARASDALRAAGVRRSAIDGLPISVKDLFDVAGHTTRSGSRVLDGAPAAAQDAVVVQRLRAAGAVLVGQTNMTEFAFSGVGINPHYGTPRNPWGRQADGGGRIPGGSSSGAAVSVADGMALAAIGSDTGGSVRIPAALCGLVGFKPTARRVPTAGALPLSTTLDSVGPIARSVACCAQLDAMLSGEGDGQVAPRPVAGLRLLVPSNLVQDDLDAGVARAWDAALARLSAAGVQLTHARLAPLDTLADMAAFGSFSAAEAWHWHQQLLTTRAQQYDPRVVSRIRRGQSMGAADYLELHARRRAFIAAMAAALAPYDALLMPTVPITAPGIAPLAADDALFFHANGLLLRNTSAINTLDGCAISLPIQTPGEAPVGLSLAACGGEDRRLLAIAAGVEAAL